MSKTAIKQIREAEDQATVLCRVAEEKAAEMRERIKAEGEAHCAAVQENAEAEYAEMLADIRQRTEAVEARKRIEAEQEAEEMKAAARERMGEAIRIIVWEIVERCQ